LTAFWQLRRKNPEVRFRPLTIESLEIQWCEYKPEQYVNGKGRWANTDWNYINAIMTFSRLGYSYFNACYHVSCHNVFILVFLCLTFRNTNWMEKMEKNISTLCLYHVSLPNYKLLMQVWSAYRHCFSLALFKNRQFSPILVSFVIISAFIFKLTQSSLISVTPVTCVCSTPVLHWFDYPSVMCHPHLAVISHCSLCLLYPLPRFYCSRPDCLNFFVIDVPAAYSHVFPWVYFLSLLLVFALFLFPCLPRSCPVFVSFCLPPVCLMDCIPVLDLCS